MARDALAIPIANNRATAAMCDEKLSEIPDNLHSTIPIKPLSNGMRSFGDRSKFDIASWLVSSDTGRVNAYTTQFATNDKPSCHHGL